MPAIIKRCQLWLLLLMLLLAAGMPLPARTMAPASDDAISLPLEPQRAVEVFLAAVDRGELKIFGKALNRSDIVPVIVEHIFRVGNPVPVTRVYSRLRQPFAPPLPENFQVNAVSATLGADGHIIETEAHVWPKQQ